MRISDWSSDVCSSDLLVRRRLGEQLAGRKKLVQRRHQSYLVVIDAPDDVMRLQILGMRQARGADQLTQGMQRVVMEIAHALGLVRSEEHTSELQSLMRISSAVFCLKNTNTETTT